MKFMSHKCACCFLQASPGCGYKWYHIKCWHPVLTMLAPHLQVQDTNYFLRKFLHVYRYLAPLVMICQFGGFFFSGNWGIIYMSVHIYSCQMVLPLHDNPYASTLSGTFLGTCLISLSL